MWLTFAEQGLKERVRENARVEGLFETVDRLLAAGVLVEGCHEKNATARDRTRSVLPFSGSAKTLEATSGSFGRDHW